MTKDQLMQSLIKRIENATKDMQIPVETPISYPEEGLAPPVVYRAPRVYYNDTPPKTLSPEDFPYVIVRLWKAQVDQTGRSVVDVKLIIGAYSEEVDGHRYAVLIGEVIERSLMEHPTLDVMFNLIHPLDWVNLETQAFPQYAIVLNTRWLIPAPVVRSEFV